MNNELRVTQVSPDRWRVENLTDAELKALRNTIARGTATDRRTLNNLHGLLEDTPIF